MKVLVTGASGQLGGALCHRLVKCGYEVIGISRSLGRCSDLADSPIFKHISMDLRNPESKLKQVVSNGPYNSAVFLSASTSRESNSREKTHGFDVDVLGHARLLEALGDRVNQLNPCSPYASAKCGADRLVYSFIKTYDIPAVILRPFNQYGPNQHLEKVIPRFITSALKNEPLTVHGKGKAKRDWLYVEDTCHRIEKVINTPIDKIQGEVFNLGSGEVFSVIEIANMVLNMLDKPKSLITYIGDRLGQVQHHCSSTEKAAKILGIKPGRPFEEGLKQTIEWYKNNEDWWRKIEWMKQIKIMTKSGKMELH